MADAAEMARRLFDIVLLFIRTRMAGRSTNLRVKLSRSGWPACVALMVAIQDLGVLVAFTQWTGTGQYAETAIPESGV